MGVPSNKLPFDDGAKPSTMVDMQHLPSPMGVSSNYDSDTKANTAWSGSIFCDDVQYVKRFSGRQTGSSEIQGG